MSICQSCFGIISVFLTIISLQPIQAPGHDKRSIRIRSTPERWAGTILLRKNPSAYLIQPDGKIVTLGYLNTESSDSDFLLARCNRNGSLDLSFGEGGKVRTSFGALNDGANDAVLQPDGKIVAVGFNARQTIAGVDFALARYVGSSP